MKKWGGKRMNSGRKLKYGEPAHQHSFNIPDSLWGWLQSQGGSPSDYVVASLRLMRSRVEIGLQNMGKQDAAGPDHRNEIADLAMHLAAAASGEFVRSNLHIIVMQLAHLLGLQLAPPAAAQEIQGESMEPRNHGVNSNSGRARPAKPATSSPGTSRRDRIR